MIVELAIIFALTAIGLSFTVKYKKKDE